ncbi:MAG: hypothetical protein K0R00_146 [Herbinix sp.]|jgi:hypothetical protein|nr:hypothetical protein [Herbinix sp.]
MEDKLKMLVNHSMEEEYAKYMERLKADCKTESEKHFRAKYMAQPYYDKKYGARDELVDLINGERRTNPLVHAIVLNCTERIDTQKNYYDRRYAGSPIEQNLDVICLALIKTLLDQNESLKKQNTEFIIRQPIRIVEVEKGTISDDSKNSINNI